ncbi:hypothetical protein AAH211_01910 [Serratia fonticola]|uniref:hypothetical protein n=1 Tax=Serratia fonticola TaxID=47917 RepID=UPI003987881D
MKTISETIYAGEFILAPGVSDDGLPDISIHSQHGTAFVATILVQDIPKWINDRQANTSLLDAELMAFWVGRMGNPSADDMLLFWRWRFVECWRHHQTEKEGRPAFTHEANGALHVLPMYPRAMRFCVASHLEGAMIEHLGPEEGIKAVLTMYTHMVAPSNTYEWLTPMGIEATERLKLVFFEAVDDLANGTFEVEAFH